MQTSDVVAMARIGFGERVRIAAVQAQGLRRHAASRVLGSRFMRWRYSLSGAHPPDMAPQCLRSPDSSFWSEVESGHFGLAGAVAFLEPGQSPFDIGPPNRAWMAELHGFGWLRHLEASTDPAAREAARDYVMSWLRGRCGASGLAASPGVRARRIMSWISHAPFLLDGATAGEFDRFSYGLSREVLLLSGGWRSTNPGYDRLAALTALVIAHLAVPGQERRLASAIARLAAEIERQILDDGGHISRNPAVLIELLLDWLPLKSCFDARRQAPPEALASAIQRMLSMLRFLRLGDGTIARFNAMGVGDPAGLSTLLAYDDRPTSHSTIAPASRYARLTRATTVVFADTGPPPPLMYSGEAHAGALSFEVSAGRSLLFVNAGAPGPADQAWRAVSRATASHTTVCLGEISSSRLVRHAGLEAHLAAVPLSLPATVEATLVEDGDGVRLDASHDGYHQRLGLIHRRRLRLAGDGAALAGTDWLETMGGQDRLKRDVPFSIHFHLHPSTQCGRSEPPSPGPDGGLVIRLLDGQRWLFRASGAVPGLEESTFFAGGSGPRPSLQIVLRGATAGVSEVNWSVALMAPAAPAGADS